MAVVQHSVRHLLLGLPAILLLGFAVGFAAIDQQIKSRIDEALATERVHVGQARLVRERAQQTYVSMLERWVQPPAGRTEKSREVDRSIVAVRNAATEYAVLQPISATEGAARNKLLVALAQFANRVQAAVVREDGPSAIAEIAEYNAAINEATLQVLSIDTAAGQSADTQLVTLRRWSSQTMVGIVLTGAVALLLSAFWWKEKRRADRRYEQAESARREQEYAAQLRARFFANLSHELRTPIVVIQNLTGRLQAPELRSIGKRIRQAADDLLHAINNILDVSRLESGRLSLNWETVTLLDVIRRSAHRCEGLIGEKDVQIRFQVAECDLSVTADVVKLYQVFTNLIANAIKFTEQGCVTVGVTQPTNDVVRVEVIDNGIGIAQNALERIWEPFEQADETIVSRFGGTGLGLSLVKTLVELHHGKVGAMSTLGKGSCFWIELPVVQEGPLR